jgi:hypothetical protein
MIEYLTGELNKAKAESDSRADQRTLILDEAEVELHYEITRSLGGGLDVKVVNVTGERARVMGNSIRVTFKPYGASQTFLAESADLPAGPGGLTYERRETENG